MPSDKKAPRRPESCAAAAAKPSAPTHNIAFRVWGGLMALLKQSGALGKTIDAQQREKMRVQADGARSAAKAQQATNTRAAIADLAHGAGAPSSSRTGQVEALAQKLDDARAKIRELVEKIHSSRIATNTYKLKNQELAEKLRSSRSIINIYKSKNQYLIEQIHSLRAKINIYADHNKNFSDVLNKYRLSRNSYKEKAMAYSDQLHLFKSNFGHMKIAYAAAHRYYGLNMQGYLAEIAQRDGARYAADAYVALLPSTLPAALQLRADHGGRVFCDNVENVDVDKQSGKQNRPPMLTQMINHAAHGALYACDGLLTVGDALETTLRRYQRPTLVLRNYRCFSEPAPAGALRAQCGFAADDVVLFASGNVVIGFEPVLRALAALPARFKLAALVRLKPETYEAEMRALIAELGLEGRVRLLPFAPYNALAGLAADADIGLITSDVANPNGAVALPNRFFDYLAGGLPVVAPAMPDVRALIRTHGCGAIVDPLTAPVWRDAIATVAADLPAFTAAAKRANRALSWESQEPALLTFLGHPKTVTLIGFRDLTRYQRFIRVASTLTRHGCEVRMLTAAREPPALDVLLPGVRYYDVRNLAARDSAVELVVPSAAATESTDEVRTDAP